MADNELGAFLRARREAVAPAEVGFPGGARRRTPGLRRAELATLAGVSVEYLTRLEQGRDRRPSPEILGALAQALDLSIDERVHLHRLSKAAVGGACQGNPPPTATVRATIKALLERLEPTPAMVVNRLDDLLAYTTGFERLAGFSGLLDTNAPNLARYVFTDPRARDAFPDWDKVADERAADLRVAASFGDAHAAFLAEELAITGGPGFRTRFDTAAILPSRSGVEQWAHPVAGDLALAYECLELPGEEEQRLFVYLPADSAAEAALAAITAKDLVR